MINGLLKHGLLYGLLGTLAMTAMMVLATVTGLSPMPAPVPVALAKWALGGLGQPVLVTIGMILHFLYGALAGAAFALLFRRKLNLWMGWVWAVLLWLGMQLIFLPLLGWGVFGSNVNLRISMATLILHLIYGGVLGWGLGRQRRSTA